jgi:DNA ligase-1
MMLDGELYAGRGRFQFCRSAAGKHEPIDEEWEQLQFMILDAPAPSAVLGDGEINEPNFKKKLKGCLGWYKERATPVIPNDRHMSFQSTYSWLRVKMPQNEYCILAPQEQLPFNTEQAFARIEERLAEILDAKGEGVIIRKPSSMWLPNRVHECLKYKPYDDAEGTVIGYTWGRETDKGSKLLGLMGNLILNYNGKRLEISGFKDEERVMQFVSDGDSEEGYKYPGEQISGAWRHPLFPVGAVVTFRYREHSDAGIPKEARYFRKLT